MLPCELSCSRMISSRVSEQIGLEVSLAFLACVGKLQCVCVCRVRAELDV